jgi:hypothetical protein
MPTMKPTTEDIYTSRIPTPYSTSRHGRIVMSGSFLGRRPEKDDLVFRENFRNLESLIRIIDHSPFTSMSEKWQKDNRIIASTEVETADIALILSPKESQSISQSARHSIGQSFNQPANQLSQLANHRALLRRDNDKNIFQEAEEVMSRRLRASIRRTILMIREDGCIPFPQTMTMDILGYHHAVSVCLDEMPIAEHLKLVYAKLAMDNLTGTEA